MKIFVTNFEDSTSVAALALLFQDFGHVEAIRLKQGKKRMYALVEMDVHRGEQAIRELDRREWHGMRLEVMESQY